MALARDPPPSDDVEPPFGLVDEFGRVAVRDADTGKVYWLGGESPEKKAAAAAPAAVVPAPSARAAPGTPGGAASGGVPHSPQDGKFYQGHSTFVGMHALQRRRSESVSAASRAAAARSPPSDSTGGAAAGAGAAGTQRSSSAAAAPTSRSGHTRKRSFFARLFKKKGAAEEQGVEHVPAYATAVGPNSTAAQDSETPSRQRRLRSGSSGSSGSRGSRSRSGSRGRARKKWDVSTTYTQRDIRELTHVRFCQALTDHARDGEHIWCSAFSKDGQFFASAGGTEGSAVVRCWAVQPWTESLRAANEVRSKAQIAKEQEARAKGPRGAPALLAAQRAQAGAGSARDGSKPAAAATASTAPKTPKTAQDDTQHKAQPSSIPPAAAAAGGPAAAASTTPQAASGDEGFESPQGVQGGVHSASPLKATPGSRMKHIDMAQRAGAAGTRDTPPAKGGGVPCLMSTQLQLKTQITRARSTPAPPL